MNNKLSELSKPAAWAFKDANDVDHASITKKANLYGRHDFQPLYSQEYVSALDKVAQFWIGESAEWKQRAEAAEQRIAELEQKLATPVRLSQRYETAGYCIDEHYCIEADDGDYLVRDELIASLRKQGFTVEDE